MKAFFTHPITITVGIIITLGILAVVGYNYWGWFGGKVANSEGSDSVPDTFYGIQCGGVAPTMRVKWYKDSGKYYSIMELLPNAPATNAPPPKASEVSEQTYRWAYKQVKAGCGDVNLPRMQEQSFTNGEKVTEPSTERKASTIPKQKSMDWHATGQYGGNKVLGTIGNKPSLFSVGENVKVDFRLSPSTPVVETINAKVISILNPSPLPASLIVINSPFEQKYVNAYGRIYS